MERAEDHREALKILHQDHSDERVESMTRLPLLSIVGLRAQLASAPATPAQRGDKVAYK